MLFPITGIFKRVCSSSSLKRKYPSRERMLARYFAMAPTFGEMLISLSLSTITRLVLLLPALFMASKIIPPEKAPSPTTATTELLSPEIFFASAIPKAAETEVLACPATNELYELSSGFGNPESPSKALRVEKISFLPVIILCTEVS